MTVAAGSLTIEGGAQIASSTAGPGKGGDVAVTVAGDVILLGPGTADHRAVDRQRRRRVDHRLGGRLLMNNGAGISTEAQTSTANGGNITLSVGDFLYLVNSEITTSVKGETGNGGNIMVDPQFVVLDRSDIIAQAIEGHGGNITIDAGAYIASADSIVSATSQLGISGTVTINGPLVDLNGTLVVLSSQLRSAVALTRNSCAARGQPAAIEPGRGRAGAVCRRIRRPRSRRSTSPAATSISVRAPPPTRARRRPGPKARCTPLHHRASDDALRRSDEQHRGRGVEPDRPARGRLSRLLRSADAEGADRRQHRGRDRHPDPRLRPPAAAGAADLRRVGRRLGGASAKQPRRA